MSDARREEVNPRPSRRWIRISINLILLLIAIAAVDSGLRLRHFLWGYTYGVHFEGDVSNGFRWGRIANGNGIFRLYDDIVEGKRFSSLAELDYTPLRLAVVTAWARWASARFPNVTQWNHDYELTQPMFWMNNLSEIASSIFIFLIIRFWVIRSSHGSLRGAIQGLIGALLFWFNPAIIWDGHCWPQWDVWLMPWFLAALWLACINRWFAAGICLTVGAFLKGQLLLAAPILLLWPIFQFRFGAVLRLVAGIAIGTAAIAFPWLNMKVPALVWYLLMLTAMGALAPLVLRWKLDWRWITGLTLAAIVMAWPWTSSASTSVQIFSISMLGLIGLSRFLPARLIPHVYALMVASAALLTIPLFNASNAWFTRGFMFGADNFARMLSGTGTYNLPRMLSLYFRWPQNINTPASLPFFDEPVTFRTQMTVIYGACLVLCGIGAAIHAWRKDTRFLVAMATPWVLFYIFMPQMHGRYLVWGAGMCALMAGAGMGMTLIGIIVSTIGFFGILVNQYSFSPSWDPEHYQLLLKVTPHLGWMLLLAAAIMLYHAVVPRTRST